MERFEGYLNNQALRGSLLYYFIATCLRSLSVTAGRFGIDIAICRLSALYQALTTAGFLPIENELATSCHPKSVAASPKVRLVEKQKSARSDALLLLIITSAKLEVPLARLAFAQHH